MERLNPRSRSDVFGRKINRTHSTSLAMGLPWISIMLCSLAPILPLIAPAPILPPLGYIALLAWRLPRPGLLPMWAGFPLGFFDDLYSGQPFGCAILLFSGTLIAIDLLEVRFPWRGFWQDWGVTAVFITAYLVLSGLVSGADLTFIQLRVIIPQLLMGIVLYPAFAYAIGLLDRLRLLRVRRLS